MRLQENKLIIISISYFMSVTKRNDANEINRRHKYLKLKRVHRDVTCWTKCFRLNSIQLLTDHKNVVFMCADIEDIWIIITIIKKEEHTQTQHTKGIQSNNHLSVSKSRCKQDNRQNINKTGRFLRIYVIRFSQLDRLFFNRVYRIIPLILSISLLIMKR